MNTERTTPEGMPMLGLYLATVTGLPKNLKAAQAHVKTTTCGQVWLEEVIEDDLAHVRVAADLVIDPETGFEFPCGGLNWYDGKVQVTIEWAH